MSIRTLTGTLLVNADAVSLGKPVSLVEGTNTIRFSLERLHLNPGTYIVDLWAGDTFHTLFDYVQSALEIEVGALIEPGMGATPRSDGVVPCRFSIESSAGTEAPEPSYADAE